MTWEEKVSLAINTAPAGIDEVVLDGVLYARKRSGSHDYWERIDMRWPSPKRRQMRMAHLERKRRRHRGGR